MMTNDSSKDTYTFWDHLEVLRHVLFRIIGFWLVCAVVLFLFVPWLFDHVILAPCNNDFVFYDLLRSLGGMFGTDGDFFTKEFNVHLVNINLSSPFFIHMSTAFGLSVVLSVPYMLWELWRFVSPGLYPNEKRHVPFVMIIGTMLFIVGLLVGYFVVFPLTLRFLSTYELSELVPNQLTLNSYMDNFVIIVTMMGLVFEIPLVLWFLSIIGLVRRGMLKRYRKHAIVIIFILAAVITPTGDPFTLTVVALPLCLLYELSIHFVRK